MSIIFMFFAVMVVTAVLFGGWVIMSIFRLIGRVLGVGPASSGERFNTSALACPNPSCRTINPNHAHYCRRCGSPMDQSLHAGFRPGIPASPFNPPNSQARQVARA
jgi:hypothetical protein